ncbi:prepilin-type N-terminal cleavage/methylation domain-containing protein [Streptococcus sp. 20-1249]|uniref:prepilin-type N-terminal cleavage/methylation domain-containing protein n=1 Tax=Streptococcus hepaticus TaxID=3349163 RepID=UPI0037496D24
MLSKLQNIRRNAKKKGFTLVELIVVIIIIAIIAAVAIPSITSFQDNARRSRIQTEHRQLVSAVQSKIGTLTDPTDPTAVAAITLDDLLPYVNKKNGKTAAGDLLAKNGTTVAHKVDKGVLTSEFIPSNSKGSSKAKTEDTFTYDFNVNK